MEERGTRNNALQVLRVESAYKKEFKYIKGYNCFFNKKYFLFFCELFYGFYSFDFFTLTARSERNPAWLRMETISVLVSSGLARIDTNMLNKLGVFFAISDKIDNVRRMKSACFLQSSSSSGFCFFQAGISLCTLCLFSATYFFAAVARSTLSIGIFDKNRNALRRSALSANESSRKTWSRRSSFHSKESKIKLAASLI